MRKIFMRWSVLGSLLLGISVTAAEDLKGELQKGLFEEEGNHNTAAAIESYRRVASQFDKDRKLAATAIFRLGECYRKEGKTNEASIYYGRILRDFSDQTNLVKAVQQVASVTRIAVAGSADVSRTMESQGAAEAAAQLAELEQLTPNKVRIAMQKILNSSVYDSLLARQLEVERTLARKQENFTPDYPEVKALLLEKKILDDQVAAHVEIGFSELSRRVAAARGSQLRAGLGGAAPRSAQAEGSVSEESEEIKRIKLLLRDSPDLINAAGTGGLTLLQEAAAKGNATLCEFLLTNGASANGSGAPELTPLHYAAGRGYKKVVELLLARGARPDAKTESGVTPLHLAVLRKFPSVTEVLIKAGAPVNALATKEDTDRTGQALHIGKGWAPLHMAAFSHDLRLADLLLAAKADVQLAMPDGSTALHLAVAANDVSMAERFIKAGAPLNDLASGRAPLHMAVQAANAEMVELLLSAKADANLLTVHNQVDSKIRGLTALHFAKDTNIIASFLRHGADLDVRSDGNAFSDQGATPLRLFAGGNLAAVRMLVGVADNDAADAQGNTPLHEAVSKRQNEIVDVLLEAGAAVNKTNLAGATPLQLAVSLAETNLVGRLLKAGANPNLGYSQGYTPLHFAVRDRQREIVELLLKAKADPNLQNNDGDTPRDFAGKTGNNEIVEMLTKAGAKDIRRLSRIFVKTARMDAPSQMFFRDTDKLNRFTIFEVFAGLTLDWPDLPHVRISRMNSSTGQTNEISIDVEAALNAENNCEGNLWLQWGDILIIPEADHRVGEKWPGLTKQQEATLRRCVARRVTLKVRGEAQQVDVTLRSTLPRTPDNLSPFRLPDFVWNSKLLRASSDLTRVKVIRAASDVPGFGKVFNLQSQIPANALFLRDGDIVDVPDKE